MLARVCALRDLGTHWRGALASLTVGLGLALLQGSTSAQEKTEFFGKAVAIEGKVSATHGLLEVEVKPEEEFSFDDEIVTGNDGKLQLSFGSSFASIGPNTSILLNKRREANKQIISITLTAGRFRSKVFLEENEGYEVVSPSGVASVSGTDFVTDFDPANKGNFQVTVIEGKVGVTPADTGVSMRDFKPLVLEFNQSGGLNDKGRAVQVHLLSPAVMDQIKRALPLPTDNQKQPALPGGPKPADELAKIDGKVMVTPAAPALPPLAEVNVVHTLQQIFNIAPAQPGPAEPARAPGQQPGPVLAQAPPTTVAPLADVTDVLQQVIATSQNLAESVKDGAVAEVNRQREETVRVKLDFKFQVD